MVRRVVHQGFAEKNRSCAPSVVDKFSQSSGPESENQDTVSEQLSRASGGCTRRTSTARGIDSIDQRQLPPEAGERAHERPSSDPSDDPLCHCTTPSRPNWYASPVLLVHTLETTVDSNVA